MSEGEKQPIFSVLFKGKIVQKKKKNVKGFQKIVFLFSSLSKPSFYCFLWSSLRQILLCKNKLHRPPAKISCNLRFLKASYDFLPS